MVDSHDMAAYMAERRRNRREKLVELLGGVCVRCDADKALDFDHIIPGSQSFRISGKALDKPWEQLLAEVKKCQLLCRPCHRIKSKECGETGGGHNRIDDHATEAMYMKGCHCDPCRQVTGLVAVLCAEHGIPMWWDEDDQLYRCAESQRGCEVTATAVTASDDARSAAPATAGRHPL